MLRLEKLGLVDLMPHDKVKLRIPKSVRLRPDGPIRRAHGKSVVTTFLDSVLGPVGYDMMGYAEGPIIKVESPL